MNTSQPTKWQNLENKLDRLGCIETTMPSKSEFSTYQDVLNQARLLLKESDPNDNMLAKINELEWFSNNLAQQPQC